MNKGLSIGALQRVRDAVAPGGRVTRVRPLRGGISASVHVVHLVDALGQRRAVVVRRYSDYWQRTDPAACGREFKLLEVLAHSPFPAPRPLMLEVDSGPFGTPTVVMTRLPGKPLLAPRDLSHYLKQMAQTLVQLHSLATQELGFLPDQRRMVTEALSERPNTADALLLEVWDAASTEWPRLSLQPETQRALVHGDYWPGNMLWLRGRLVGVVDWEQPRLGELARDVATCRGDLWVLFGQEAADTFLAEYERAAGVSVNDLRFWELLIATWALPEMKDWAAAYRILGRPDLTADTAVSRIREFARVALRR